jgi:hypothetical protein
MALEKQMALERQEKEEVQKRKQAESQMAGQDVQSWTETLPQKQDIVPEQTAVKSERLISHVEEISEDEVPEMEEDDGEYARKEKAKATVSVTTGRSIPPPRPSTSVKVTFTQRENPYSLPARNPNDGKKPFLCDSRNSLELTHYFRRTRSTNLILTGAHGTSADRQEDF